MKIQFYEATNQGARESNQDYFSHVITEDWCCFVLADGLGGHFRGDIASKAYCEALCTQALHHAEKIVKTHAQGIDELMLDAWKIMCHDIHAQYGKVDSHTTITIAWLDDNQFISAHVGDSRVYRLNANEIIFRTPDHTPVQELYEKHLITEDDFAGHPLQNRLLRTVNLYDAPLADIFVQDPLEKGETVILCSDGLWNFLMKDQIGQLGITENVPKTCKMLMDGIVEKHPNSADNITVQVVRLV